jgi:hypothetical protein
MLELLQEIRKNTRLRLGLWAILAIIALYWLLVLDEYKNKLQLEYQAELTSLARLRDVTSQAEWLDRAELARSAEINLESKLWNAASKGLAQADFQAWLGGQVAGARILEPRMTVEEARDVPPQLWLVIARLEGIFEPEPMERLLLNLAQHPNWVVVDSFEIRHGNRDMRFSLVMHIYFQAI